MKNLVPLMLVINAVAALVTGSYVYMRAKNRPQNALWLVYNVLFSMWSFCIYSAIRTTEELAILYWFRASLCALIFMVPVFLHFLSYYSDREVFKKHVIRKLYLFSFFIFVLSFIMPEGMVRSVGKSIYFKYAIEPGVPFHVFALIFTGFVLCGFYYLLVTKKLYLNFKRNQRGWLFIGMLLGMMAPFSFLLAVYGVDIFPFGLFCVIPYLAVTAYSMIRYHVPEVNVAVNKAVLLSYGALIIIITHAAALYLLHRILGMEYFESSVLAGCVILLGLLFAIHFGSPYRMKILADSVIYEKRINYYRYLEKFNAMMEKVNDFGVLVASATESLRESIDAECAALYLFDEEHSEFALKAFKGKAAAGEKAIERIPISNPLVNFLREGNVFVAGESGDFLQEYNLREIKKEFESINVQLTVPLYYSMPLYSGMDIIGFLNLGNKKTGEKYSREDMDILNAFGRQLGVCIENANLFSRSIRDDLTKLYRLNYFYQRFGEELERSSRYNRPLSMLLIDVDDFKMINDFFGHQSGDEVLRRIAYMLKTRLRGVDIVARYGGEEFAVLLPETDKTNAIIAAERCRKMVEEEFSKPGAINEIIKKGFADKGKFRVTVSAGVSTYRPGADKETLIREADKALYESKRQGKNTISG